MKKIELHGAQTKYALVDDIDFLLLNGYRWHLNTGGYARLNPKGRYKSGVRVQTLMHRILLVAPHEAQVDHINGDKLDNRRENLRLVTAQQNKFNQKLRCIPNKSSKYKGVALMKKRRGTKVWMSRLMHNAKSIFLGYHTTQEGAARAYNRAAVDYFGQYARLNNL